jgi:hypothetical protein
VKRAGATGKIVATWRIHPRIDWNFWRVVQFS